MKILYPSAFWFLLIIPPVIFLYFMKLRRKEFKTTAGFLWNRVMKEARVDSFFQKLKINILLILQIILLVLIILSLLGPYFTSYGVLSKETILIVDNSASMKAIEKGKKRIDIAKEKIKKIINESPPKSSFMLITVSNSSKILSGFTRDKKKLRRLVSKIKCSDNNTNLKSAFTLTLSLIKGHPEVGIILVGDKSGFNKKIGFSKIDNFRFISVGKTTNNIGITAFKISKFSRSSKGEIFIKVRNFSTLPINSYIELYFNNKLTEARQLNLKGLGNKEFVFYVPVKFSGIMKAKIPYNDSFKLDNIAYGVIRSSDNIKILLISSSDDFLVKALKLLPDTQLKILPLSDKISKVISLFDVVIWNNCSIPKINRGNHIFINRAPKNSEIKYVGFYHYPVIASWDKNSPILRYVNFSDISIEKSKKFNLTPDCKVLLYSNKGPLIFYIDKKGFKRIFLNFNVMDSDWPLFPSFPIFLNNSIEFLANKGVLSLTDSFKTGDSLSLDFIAQDGEIDIRTPYNRTIKGIIKTSKVLALDNVGIYKILVKNKKCIYEVPVNLSDYDESDIKPDISITTKKAKKNSKIKIPLIREIWRELIFIALIVLLLEWYIFNKKRV